MSNLLAIIPLHSCYEYTRIEWNAKFYHHFEKKRNVVFCKSEIGLWTLTYVITWVEEKLQLWTDVNKNNWSRNKVPALVLHRWNIFHSMVECLLILRERFAMSEASGRLVCNHAINWNVNRRLWILRPTSSMFSSLRIVYNVHTDFWQSSTWGFIPA